MDLKNLTLANLTDAVPAEVYDGLLATAINAPRRKRNAHLVFAIEGGDKPFSIQSSYKNVTRAELSHAIMKDAKLGDLASCDLFRDLLIHRRDHLKGVFFKKIREEIDNFCAYDIETIRQIDPKYIECLYTTSLAPDDLLKDIEDVSEPGEFYYQICFEDEASWMFMQKLLKMW